MNHMPDNKKKVLPKIYKLQPGKRDTEFLIKYNDISNPMVTILRSTGNRNAKMAGCTKL